MVWDDVGWEFLIFWCCAFGATKAQWNRRSQSKRNIVRVERFAVVAVAPIDDARTLVGHVVAFLLFFPFAATVRLRRGGTLAGGEAVFPLLAFEIVIVIAV